MVRPGMLVFDMDGVLVDVSDSYRETIVQTVKHFTGQTITRELIQQYKNQGGWNNDWALSQQIARDLGTEAEYDDVVKQFNRLWMGHDGLEGLVARERWIGSTELFERLGAAYRMAIFTGRMHYEVDITLGRFAPTIKFDPIICAEDVTNGKPAPDGLHNICEQNPGVQLLYFGDVVDDARSAKAAGVPFVGVTHRDDTAELLRQEGAIAVLKDINQIGTVLA